MIILIRIQYLIRVGLEVCQSSRRFRILTVYNRVKVVRGFNIFDAVIMLLTLYAIVNFYFK